MYTEVGKTMSLSKSKTCLTGVLLAIFFAMTGTVMAQTGLRLWSPYQPESFGGSRRSNDGVYGSLEGILWKVDGPKGIPIGYRNPDGTAATRKVFATDKTVHSQISSMNTNNAESDFTLGTRLEFGNRRGHHGWLFSGYGLANCGGSYEQRNGSMVIHDPENLTAYGVYWADGAFNQVWQPDGSFSIVPGPNNYGGMYDLTTKVPINNVGYLWGWTPVEWADWMEGYLGPLPINFDRAQLTNSVDIVSLELMYTYRPHPFKWGEMEFLAGGRFWNFDDTMTFLGLGYKEAYDEWEQQQIDDLTGEDEDNNGNSSSGSSSNNGDDDGVNLGEVNSNALGPLSVLADTRIVGHANNRITGPQFGVKFSRRNARWTFGAEARFLAGINGQSNTVSGTFGTNFVNTAGVPTIGGGFLNGGSDGSGSGSGSNTNNVSLQNSGIIPYMPIGFTRNTQSFYHHSNKTYFSPGVELRLSAKWQWTDAVGVQVGFNSTIVDNVARGADIVDYRIQDDGTLFGLRTSKTTVIVYGFNIGLTMTR